MNGMTHSKPHRKRVCHFDAQGEIHELTFSCYRQLPLLEDEWRCKQLSIAIERAAERHDWRLAAFVFMPEHLHLIVYPGKAGLRISKLLFAIKRPFSFRVKQQLTKSSDPLLQRLTIQQRPGNTTFRFWQEGPGYDRNIRNTKVLQAAIDYVHLNPVRRGLVKQASEYRWSSAAWYASDGQEICTSHPKLSAVPPDWFVEGSDYTCY